MNFVLLKICSSYQMTSSRAWHIEYWQIVLVQEYQWPASLPPVTRYHQEFMGQLRSCYQKIIPQGIGKLL